MSWLKDLASGLGLDDFYEDAKKNIAKWNNATFRDGIMATCALIAAADGTIEPEEKTKVAALIQKNEMLKVFSATELRDIFFDFCTKAEDEFQRIDLFSLVGKLKHNPEQANTALKVALIIANADGVFAPEEKAMVKELCQELNLPSENYVHD